MSKLLLTGKDQSGVKQPNSLAEGRPVQSNLIFSNQHSSEFAIIKQIKFTSWLPYFTWVLHVLPWGVTRMAYSPRFWLMAIGGWNKINQCRKLELNLTQINLRSLYESWFRNALISKSVILWWQAKKGINSELEGLLKRTQSLKHSFKKVSVSHAQLAHFSTLAKEKPHAYHLKLLHTHIYHKC